MTKIWKMEMLLKSMHFTDKSLQSHFKRLRYDTVLSMFLEVLCIRRLWINTLSITCQNNSTKWSPSAVADWRSASFPSPSQPFPSPLMAMWQRNTRLLGSLRPPRRADHISVPLVSELCSPLLLNTFPRSYALNRCFGLKPADLGQVPMFLSRSQM